MCPGEPDRHWMRVTVRSPHAAADAVGAVLIENCPNGISIDDGGDNLVLTAYLPPTCHAPDPDAAASAIRHALRAVPETLLPRPVRIAAEAVAERDWVQAFRAHCHPVREGRIVIKPTWEPWPSPEMSAHDDDLVVELDPGMAFGTGTHPTTQACLSALQRTVTPGARVIDFGCGSGILGIAAQMLGAGEVLALDCDHLAVTATRANATLNGVSERLRVVQGDSLGGLRPHWDVIVANISAPATAAATPGARFLLREGGRYICAGIPSERGAQVHEALAEAGFADITRETRGQWVLLSGSAPGDGECSP